jgi:copper chaperone NosL
MNVSDRSVTTHSINRRPGAQWRRAVLVAAVALVAACADQVATRAIEPAADAACALDGMLLADFPGPKGQVLYDQGAPDFFCDTVELVAALLAPEQHKRVVAVYTQDMAQASWDKPQGHWIDARAAFYVVGSRKTGSMGPTLGTFAHEADANAFARDNGGKVLRYAEITPQMVTLDGGVVKDAL